MLLFVHDISFSKLYKIFDFSKILYFIFTRIEGVLFLIHKPFTQYVNILYVPYEQK
jgi:hypothetical protein